MVFLMKNNKKTTNKEIKNSQKKVRTGLANARLLLRR